MEKLPSSSTRHPEYHLEPSGMWLCSAAPYTVEPEPYRRPSGSLLSAIFGHRRSRSAEPRARDLFPPSYEDAMKHPNSNRSRCEYDSPEWLRTPLRKESLEDALEILKKYDTVILMDDSGSMALPGSRRGVTRWDEAGQALEALAETAQKYDDDGLDICFINSPDEAFNVKTAAQVRNIFYQVTPKGATNTGERLEQILKPRLVELENAKIASDGTPRNRRTGETIKRVNFIIITDGEATDSPKYTIIDAAKRLKAIPNLCLTQVGIQFVQIGSDATATRALKELDDDLAKAGDIRDIVDTTPYSKLNPVTADGLIKVLIGGINRRVDEQKNRYR